MYSLKLIFTQCKIADMYRNKSCENKRIREVRVHSDLLTRNGIS